MLIRQLQGMLGGKSIRGGSATATFTAAPISAQVTIPHGLPTTPSEVLLSNRQPQNGIFTLHENAPADATNIYVVLRQAQNVAVTITQNFYWQVRG